MLPPEVILELQEAPYCALYFFFFGWGFLFCGFCGHAVTSPYCQPKAYIFSSMRIGVSMVEWLVIIFWGLLVTTGVVNDTDYLFSFGHCLGFFIVCLTFFVVYTLFPFLMPDIRLPKAVSIRSIAGYCFLGELTELERLDRLGTNWDLPFGFGSSEENEINKLSRMFVNEFLKDNKPGVGSIIVREAAVFARKSVELGFTLRKLKDLSEKELQDYTLHFKGTHWDNYAHIAKLPYFARVWEQFF